MTYSDIKDDEPIEGSKDIDLPDLGESFFEEADVEHDKLTGKDMDVTEILAKIRETGGVNQDVALQMESLEPGLLETKFLTVRHFTQDYSRTNLKVSQEALEDMSQGAKIAIAVGVGVFVSSLVAWILSKVFGDGDEDSGGGGGGGGGSKGGSGGIKHRDLEERKKQVSTDYRELHKILEDIAAIERDLHKELEAKAETVGLTALYKELGVTGPVTTKKTAEAIYGKHLRKHYSKLLDDLINKPTTHVALAHHLVTSLPKWVRDLASLQNDLFHKEKGKVDAAKYRMKFDLPGSIPMSVQGMAGLLETYRKLAEADTSLAFPKIENIEHANFLESTIKQLPDSQGHLVQDMKADLEASVEILKSSPTELAEKNEAISAIRNSWRELGMVYQFLVLVTNKCDQFLKDLEVARNEAGTVFEKMGSELIKEAKTDDQKSSLKSFIGKIKDWVKRKK